MKRIVHVVGHGNDRSASLGLFTDFRERLGIDEVTFHKRTPLAGDRSRVRHLIERGAKLAVDEDVRGEFEKLGHEVSLDTREALNSATVVVDCTPAGNENKEKFYEGLTGPKGFLAQGSEFGFGKPYARGVNDEILVLGEDRFIQIVSCNTHNITTLVKTVCNDGDDQEYCLNKGTFVCMRRSNDISQGRQLRARPQRGQARRPRLRHSPRPRRPPRLRDAAQRHEPVLQSAVKLNTQYMHSIWFNLELNRDTTVEEVRAAFARQPAGGGDRQALRQPDLQLRPRPRLLRPHPVADGGGLSDGDGAPQARGLRLLFHPAGRQLAPLLGGPRPSGSSSRTGERVAPLAAAAPLAVPGDLTAPPPRASTGRGAARHFLFMMRPVELRLGDLRIEGWSRAGDETWFRVHPAGLAFDTGRGAFQLAGAHDVFLSHGHLDHALGLPYVLSRVRCTAW